MTLNGYRHTPSPDFLMRKTGRKKTEGIAEYVVNHGKFSFSDVPFGPADSLVFSIPSYLTPEAVFPDFDGRQKMPLKRLAKLYERHYVPPKHPGRFSMEARAPKLLYRLAVSARFSEIAVTDYESYLDEEKESQFAAMTFSAQNGSIYITYRGTDDHIIGWKEDFNMSCCDSVPSQKRALLYLKQQAEREETERIFLGGHSKGGNLAVYAAAFADRAVQRKIAGIHSFDSPGFSERFFSYPGYRSISGRIINFMPENSMVGRLFEHRAEIRIVRSRARGFLQHIPFYWCISGSDFIYTGSFGRSSRMFAETMRNWISGPDDEEKKMFVDALFDLLSDAGIRTTGEMHLDSGKIRRLFGSIRSMSERNRKNFFRWIGRLLKESGRTAGRDLFSAGGFSSGDSGRRQSLCAAEETDDRREKTEKK